MTSATVYYRVIQTLSEVVNFVVNFESEPNLAILWQVLFFFSLQLINSHSVLYSSSFGSSHKKCFN